MSLSVNQWFTQLLTHKQLIWYNCLYRVMAVFGGSLLSGAGGVAVYKKPKVPNLQR